MYAVRVPRKSLGEKLQHWHSSGSDPIYAVGSFYFSGQVYPKREIVERALSSIESIIPKAEAGAHGWTRRDAAELKTIARGLRYYLRHDYGGAT